MRINEFTPDLKVFSKINKEETKSKEYGEEFSSMLKSALNDVNEKQIKAEDSTKSFIEGDMDLHKVLTIGEEAKLSLDLAIQVRNKLINAYEEFNKMQI